MEAAHASSCARLPAAGEAPNEPITASIHSPDWIQGKWVSWPARALCSLPHRWRFMGLKVTPLFSSIPAFICRPDWSEKAESDGDVENTLHHFQSPSWILMARSTKTTQTSSMFLELQSDPPLRLTFETQEAAFGSTCVIRQLGLTPVPSLQSRSESSTSFLL